MSEDDISPPYWKIDDPRGLLGQTRAVALMRSDKRASYKHMALIEFHWGWAHEKYDWTSLASVRRMHSVLTERNPLGQPGMTTRHINSGNRELCEWGWLFELDKGSGRHASRFLPNYAVFNIADTGNFAKFVDGEVTCSVSRVGTHNGYEILCIPNGDTDACTYEVNANRFSVSPVGNKDSLTGTVLQDGATERDIDCAAPLAPPPAAGLSAATAAGTAQDETRIAKTGFDELWDAYGYKRGKPEARRAYAQLAPSADLHAEMVESARAWRETWAAQDKPDAPRFTLTKWLEREEYECTPPTAYKPKERKAKPDDGKPASKTRGHLTDQLRLLETEFIGSPFGDYRMRLKLDGPGGDQEHILKVLADTGTGEDNEVFNKLQRAFGSDADEWPGQRLRLEMDGDRIVDLLPERRPDRRVKIVSAAPVDLDDCKMIVAKVTDDNGKPEGGIEITYESDDKHEQEKGQARLRKLIAAVGLDSLSDTDELIGRILTVTASGDFKPMPVELAEAA
ncbi:MULTISPECIES: hypothetical protein [unclassified Mesorhizobium]|uniref:hypothetical protein n=1 Tax=unclassified Mesorhizobium TaxID=325217 RepID=UPI0010919FF0|nr:MULTISPECIES: hypothetical protein [unclassified Mesorhizobium]TGP88921.1 hypothetical protein EN861_27055 [Mesorhizobium sp. M8A.F.Ca.ET.218.01.1.1]TGT16081.1 hypothetical protein EN856_26590 [Mesorhizobium sp. M8A.F.Ca.ET.213.01.1.1]